MQFSFCLALLVTMSPPRPHTMLTLLFTTAIFFFLFDLFSSISVTQSTVGMLKRK